MNRLEGIIYSEENMTFISDSVIMCSVIYVNKFRPNGVVPSNVVWTKLWIYFKTLIFNEDILLHHLLKQIFF